MRDKPTGRRLHFYHLRKVTPPPYPDPVRGYLTLWGRTRAVVVLMQISRRGVTCAKISRIISGSLTLEGHLSLKLRSLALRTTVLLNLNFIFHLTTWSISCAFIYGLIVKQGCVIPRCTEGFLEPSLTYSALPKFPGFPALSPVPCWDFHSYLCDSPTLPHQILPPFWLIILSSLCLIFFSFSHLQSWAWSRTNFSALLPVCLREWLIKWLI